LNYTEARAYLFNRHQKGLKLGLERMNTLLYLIGQPQNAYASVHIAGTNGKGSTAAMLAAVLSKAGYRTGLYTSPHLIDMRERIQIDGKTIGRDELVSLLNNISGDIDHTDASFFECITALAFLHFKNREVDIAVVETGLGGRLDATNVMRPVLSIVTEIGLDHTKILGKTLKPIAVEKAGIFKSGIPCIIGSRNKSVNAFFTQRAEETGCPISFSESAVKFRHIRLTETGSWMLAITKAREYPDLFLNLAGEHQLNNLATVLLAIDQLVNFGWNISVHAVRQGLSSVKWPARLDLIRKRPKILLDSAHNAPGMKRLAKAVRTLFSFERLILIFGVLEDKDYRTMFRTIAPLTSCIILTTPLSERALPAEKLEALARAENRTYWIRPGIKDALSLALSMADRNDMIVGTGSIYFVGELLRLCKKSKQLFLT
jgi:dihydrofolate synthase/folylpolyglutamate synthase